jgi:hypothetical protein
MKSKNTRRDSNRSRHYVNETKNFVMNVDPPKILVTINEEDWLQIQSYVEACDIEMTGFGVVKKIRRRDGSGVNHRLHIERLLPLPLQYNTCANSTVTPEDLKNLIDSNVPSDKKNTVAFMWHSHAEMPSYWSDTDIKNQNDWLGSQFLISLVINKYTEYEIRYDEYTPFRHTCDDIHLKVLSDKSRLMESKKAIEAVCIDYDASWDSQWAKGFFRDGGTKTHDTVPPFMAGLCALPLNKNNNNNDDVINETKLKKE